MTKIFRLTFLFLFISNIVFAQQNETTNEKTLLWRISGNELSEPSYLYGTIHIPNTKYLNFSDSTNAILARVNSIVIETSKPSLFEILASGITLDEGQTLKELLGEEDYKKLESYTTYNRYPSLLLPMLNETKPIVVHSNISKSYIEKNTNQIMDYVFVSKAKKNDKNIVLLETPSEQLEAIWGVDMNEQVAMLRVYLHETIKEIEDMNRITSAYLDQDIDEISNFYVDYKKKYPNYVKGVITNRNKTMSNRIDSLLDIESNRFIAIGAAHLGGNTGIISTLTQKGYTIEPILPTYTTTIKWINIDNDAFICKFPNTKPEEIKLENDTLSSIMCFSSERITSNKKTNFSVYFYSIKKESSEKIEPYSLEKMERDLISNEKIKSIKKITIGETIALDVCFDNENNDAKFLRVTYFVNPTGNKMATLIIQGDKSAINSPSSNEFIHSFKLK